MSIDNADRARLGELLDALWQSYVQVTPVAARVHALLGERGETIVNDHVALRTFAHPAVEIEVLDRELVAGGYVPVADYSFDDKKLIAYHYEHPDPGWPKFFISALLIDELSASNRELIESLVSQIPPGATSEPQFAASGRRWDLRWADYHRLRRESEYAAWLAAFGFRANHFTVSVNDLSTFDDLAQLGQFLEQNGIELSRAGGLVKGSPADLLEQSSTRAETVEVELSDGREHIPSCYYEFARRYPDENGRLFQGFVPASANRLFESTDPKP